MKIVVDFILCFALVTAFGCATPDRSRHEPPPARSAPTSKNSAPQSPVEAPIGVVPPEANSPLPVAKPTDAETKPSPSESPTVNPATNIVELDEKYFVIHYDTAFRTARYVQYRLKAENLRRSFVKRRDHFHADPKLEELGLDAVGPNDYKYSGYDRGHLAPSGDFEWSEEANEATFTMANMEPQKPGLNRHAWKRLEEEVRGWACADGEVTVVTGPLISKSLSKLTSGVIVPEQFFKVIIDETPPRKAIAFVMSQEDSSERLFSERVFTVKEVERLTGFDFVESYSKADKLLLESHSDLRDWKSERCKGESPSFIESQESSKDHWTPPTAESKHDSSCTVGTLHSATIRGCCSGHRGVMGPKKYRACCEDDLRVICNDGTKSAGCLCGPEIPN